MMLLGYTFLMTALCLLFLIAAMLSCETPKRGLPMSPPHLCNELNNGRAQRVTRLSMAVDVNKSWGRHGEVLRES